MAIEIPEQEVFERLRRELAAADKTIVENWSIDAENARLRGEVERLAADYAKLHGVVQVYIDAPGQIRGEAFRDLAGTMEHLAGRDDAQGWAACCRRLEAEHARLRKKILQLAKVAKHFWQDRDRHSQQADVRTDDAVCFSNQAARLAKQVIRLELLAAEQAETINRLRHQFEIPTVAVDDDLSEGPVAISYTDQGRKGYGAAENLPCAVALAFVGEDAARDWWKRNEAKIHAERSRPLLQLLPLRRAIPVDSVQIATGDNPGGLASDSEAREWWGRIPVDGPPSKS